MLHLKILLKKESWVQEKWSWSILPRDAFTTPKKSRNTIQLSIHMANGSKTSRSNSMNCQKQISLNTFLSMHWRLFGVVMDIRKILFVIPSFRWRKMAKFLLFQWDLTHRWLFWVKSRSHCLLTSSNNLRKSRIHRSMQFVKNRWSVLKCTWVLTEIFAKMFRKMPRKSSLILRCSLTDCVI